MKNKIKYHSTLRMTFCMLSCFLLISGVKAQVSESKRPSLGNHIFTPVTYSQLPFTNTYFNTTTGIGITKDLVHSLNILPGLDLQGLQGELTFVDLDVFYQQQVRDWLSAYLHYQLSAQIGTQVQSILTQGINTVTGFEIGWHIKILERENYALSTIVELQNLKGSFISVSGFVRDIINGHPNPSLSETVPVLAFSSGFRFAWGINDLVGLKASTNLAYGETYSRGINAFAMDAGAGLDLDFYPRFDFPAGFVLYYNISSMPDLVYLNDKYAHQIRLKIAYTKARDFSLGFEYSYMKMPLENQSKHPTVHSISLAARYYF